MKQYPLEILSVGDDDFMVMSKGHHDPDAFMAAVAKAGYGDWPLGSPTHEWVRITPSRNPEYSHYYTTAEPGSRGAFPATYAREYYGDGK